MTFEIEYDKQPRKFLKNQDKHIAKRVMDKIKEALTNNPVPHNVISVVGKHGVFRIRIGDYRAAYRINYGENKIIVFLLDKRGRIEY